MPRTCTVCQHGEREAIDAALLAGESFRNIAERFGTSASALHRHKSDHIPAQMAQAQQAAQMAHADSLLDQVRTLQSKALAILRKAEDAGDLRTALMAMREARGNLELLARLLGELQDQTTVNVLVTSPEWLTLRSVILQAMEPYPVARLTLAEAIALVGA